MVHPCSHCTILDANHFGVKKFTALDRKIGVIANMNSNTTCKILLPQRTTVPR